MPAFINEWIEIPVSVSGQHKLDIGHAKGAWKAGRWSDAYALADQLIGEGIKTPEIARLRLRSALKLDDVDKIAVAVADMGDAVSTFAAARALSKAGRLEAAAAAFGSLRSEHPDFNHQALTRSVEQLTAKLAAQGDTIRRTDDIWGAVAVWQVALVADPTSEGISRRLRAAKLHVLTDAIASNLEDDAQQYADAWSLVIAIDPTDKRAYRRLALAAEKYENFSSAAECWKHLIMVDPTNEVAPSRLARSAVKSDNPSVYLNFLSKCGPVDMTNPHIRKLTKQTVDAAREQVKQENFASAAPLLALVRTLNSDDARICRLTNTTLRNLTHMAKNNFKEEKFVSSIEVCDLILLLDSKHTVALSILARALLRLKSYNAAYRASQELMGIEPANIKYSEWNARARLLAERQSAAS